MSSKFNTLRTPVAIGMAAAIALGGAACSGSGKNTAPRSSHSASAPARGNGGPLTSFKIDNVTTEGPWGNVTTTYLINEGGPVEERLFGGGVDTVVAHGGKIAIECVVDDAKGSLSTPDAPNGEGEIYVAMPTPTDLGGEGYIATAGTAETLSQSAASSTLALCIY